MKIEIVSVNIDYSGGMINGVVVNFFGSYAKSGNLSVNGNIPLTFPEYSANAGVEQLEALVKSKIVTIIESEVTVEQTEEV